MPLRPVGEDSGNLDPVSAARAMLRDGSLLPAGKTRVSGRVVQVLRNRTGEVTWYFDARTMQPVRAVLHPAAGHGRFTATTDFVSVDRLADTPENRQDLTPARVITGRPVPASPTTGGGNTTTPGTTTTPQP